MSASDWTHLEVREIKAETDKAICVRLSEDIYGKGYRDLWIPLSVIADSDDYNKGDKNCTVSVQRWWAIKSGLEDDD